MRYLSFLLICLSGFIPVTAQDSLSYQKPPKAILELADVSLAPRVRLDDKAENMLLLHRNMYRSIEELSEPELRLAGLRINPKTNIGSRASYYYNIELKNPGEKEARKITGLPDKARLAFISWSPDQSKFAFTNTTSRGVQLWYVDIKKAQAFQLTGDKLNANMGQPFVWAPDGKSLLVKTISAERNPLIDEAEAIPQGPTVSISEGARAQNRTYQDLLKNPNDEFNFEQLTTSEIYSIQLDGTRKLWAPSSMYGGISYSPDGRYVMTSEIQRPFSYLVPYHRFPEVTKIHTHSGDLVTTVNEVPLDEVRPKGFMATRTGKRSMHWRADEPATLAWVEALDGGDPEVEVDHRDEVFILRAPFDGVPQSIFKTIDRYSGIDWGDANRAICYDYWWNTRNIRMSLFNPSEPDAEPIILQNRNYQDRYSDPGDLIKRRNRFNRPVVDMTDDCIYFIGEGYTEKGQFPFIDKVELANLEKTRLYESAYTEQKESIYDAIDLKSGMFLVRIESPSEYPNFYFKNINDHELHQITSFDNPFTSIQNVHKEVITYQRDDGLELSGTLYLPVGYDRQKKAKMPMILWAYPSEYKDKATAGQITSNPNEFIFPHYGSPIYWLTQGYVLLDDAAFPIVGEGDAEPNDSFRKQLVSNAKAAIDAVDKLGYIDKDRVAVGGHSYGAFMTANLLSHSDLFAAGIARSGAYNRTLTPFGFQSEVRHYWDAPEVYYKMSPFMHADKMKTPLLLIHGADDNNSGTYPLQSKRYFNALKGLGATARLVMLPKESHGYRAKESILHVLWEQHQWLEKYVKNRVVLPSIE